MIIAVSYYILVLYKLFILQILNMIKSNKYQMIFNIHMYVLLTLKLYCNN